MSGRRGRGRPVEHRLGEDIATICALARPEATTSPSDLAALLGVTQARASEIVDSLSVESVDDANADAVEGPLLPLCGVGGGGRVRRLTATGGARYPALRLTPAQALATAAALDRVGITPGTDLRSRLEAAFFPRDAQSGNKEARTADAPDDTPSTGEEHLTALMTCATSLARTVATDDAASVRGPVVDFRYRGTNDLLARSRRFVPLGLRVQDGSWVVDGFDLDARAARSFRAANMTDARILDREATVPLTNSERPDGGSVVLSCSPEAAQVVLTWSGAHVVGQDGDVTHVEVPYYRGDWLPRHVLALGRGVTHASPSLQREMRDIARADLAVARRIRH